MSVLNPNKAFLQSIFGQPAYKAATTIPQTATGTIFTVTGGKVAITSLTGEVTTVIGATTVNFNVVYTPAGGSAADLCAATVCTSDAVGTLYSLVSGIAADLLSIQSTSIITVTTPILAAEVPTVTYAPMLRQPLVVRAGAVGFKTSASTTGAVKWVCTWVPLDDGAALA